MSNVEIENLKTEIEHCKNELTHARNERDYKYVSVLEDKLERLQSNLSAFQSLEKTEDFQEYLMSGGVK